MRFLWKHAVEQACPVALHPLMDYADIPDRLPSIPHLPVSNLFLSPISLWTCQACPPIGGVHVYTRMPSTSIIPLSQPIFFCTVPRHSYWYPRPFIFYTQSFSRQPIPPRSLPDPQLSQDMLGLTSDWRCTYVHIQCLPHPSSHYHKPYFSVLFHNTHIGIPDHFSSTQSLSVSNRFPNP